MNSSTYKLNFWLLCASSYLFFSSFTMVLPELPAYLRGMGGEKYLGLIISLFTLTAGISRPFSGKLADKWGRIPVMIFGSIVSAMALLMYPFMATVWGLLFMRLVHGFSTGFKPTGTSAYVADIVPPDKRGEAMGILSMFGTIGMASSPIYGSAIFNAFGINTLFYTGAVFAALSVMILIGMKETLTDRKKFSLDMLKLSRGDLYEPAVWWPSLIMLLTCFSFGTVITLSPDFSEHLGIQNKGLFYSFFTGSSLLVRIIGGRLSDKYGRVIILRYATLVLAIAMLAIGFSSHKIMFLASAFLFGIGYGFNSPTLFAWAIDLSPHDSKGKGISTLFIFLEIGIGMGALMSGTWYAGFPARFPLLFSSAAFLSFVAFLVLWRLPNHMTTHNKTAR